MPFPTTEEMNFVLATLNKNAHFIPILFFGIITLGLVCIAVMKNIRK